MNNLVHLIISDSLVLALGSALLHSVWQGALVALLLCGCLAVFRSSRLRYTLACCSLLLLTAAFIATFRFELSKGRNKSTTPALTPAVQLNVSRAFPTSPDSLAALPPKMTKFLPAAVGLWMTGVLLLTIRGAAGWRAIWRLKRDATRIVDAEVLARFAMLAKRLGIARKIKLARSNLAESPLTAGWLKPMILLPVTTLSGLTAEELETILLHELAHIRRHDYIINLTQCLLEILFFHHPATWWISARIRQEREHCCDDLVLEHVSDRLNYIRALSRIEEHRSEFPALSLASGGGSLLQRIQRIAGRETVPSGRSTIPIVIGVILGGAVILMPLLVVRARAANAANVARQEKSSTAKSDSEKEKPTSERIGADAPLRKMLAEYEETLEKIQSELHATRLNYGLSDAAIEQNAASQQEALRTIENHRLGLVSERATLNDLARRLEKLSSTQRIQSLSILRPDPILSDLLQAKAKGEQDLARLLEDFAPTHPDVKRATRIRDVITRQIEERVSAIQSGIEIEKESKEAALAQLENLAKGMQQTQLDNDQKFRRYFELKRAYENKRHIYETLLAREAESRASVRP
jgi:beta-lactamase regulating signal transducer with metallopeptidase domain